jgi:hypothetical protein
LARTNYIIDVKSRDSIKRAYLPWENNLPEEDKVWFEHHKMTEAVYQEYVNLTSKVKLGDKKKTDDKTEFDMMLGTSRQFLLAKLAVDWNLEDSDGKPIPMTETTLKMMDPRVIKVWVDDIYDFNPVLSSDDEKEEDVVLNAKGEKSPKA